MASDFLCRGPLTVVAASLLWGVTAAAMADGPELAEPDYQYYEVDAEGRDLLGAINHVTPVREGGSLFHGYTRWVVEWRVNWQPGILGDCRITRSRVTLNGSIVLPRLVAGSPEQQERFGHYIDALRVHELGHYVNGRLAAMAVEQKLASLPPMEDCDTLRQNANAAALAIVEFYQERDREYDRETAHGRTQGASLGS